MACFQLSLLKVRVKGQSALNTGNTALHYATRMIDPNCEWLSSTIITVNLVKRVCNLGHRANISPSIAKPLPLSNVTSTITCELYTFYLLNLKVRHWCNRVNGIRYTYGKVLLVNAEDYKLRLWSARCFT